MKLELTGILDQPGASVPFSTEVDLSGLDYGGQNPLPRPVSASGTVRNTAGVLVMKGVIRAELTGVCDRCAADFSREVDFPIDVVLSADPSDEEDESVFPLEGGCADLEDIVRTAVVLNMDQKLLCRPDCKGVCFRCGKNLNEGPCGCGREPDPRTAALARLLKK